MLATCAAALVASAAGAAVITPDVPYSSPGAPGDELTFDLYRPSNDNYSGGYTIVLVHGGSYCCGDKQDFRQQAIALADLGYAVISPNYTLSTPTSPSFPQPIADTLNVMRWVRTQGAALGLPDRIILGGHSAGATIAITAAMAAQSSLAANFQNLPPADRRGFVVDGAIGISGRYDIAWNVSVGIPATVVQYLGLTIGAPGWLPLYQSASAVSYVNPCSPPTVLIHGSADALVPVANSQRLAADLRAALVPVQLEIVPGGSHDLVVAGATPALQAARIAQAAQQIDLMTSDTCGRVRNALPTGACCTDAGACTVTFASGCVAATWQSGDSCDPSSCEPAGVCCVDDTCSMIVQSACAGSWTFGGACAPFTCEPVGVCCVGTACSVVAQAICSGGWTPGGACAADSCQVPPDSGTCCRGVTCQVTLPALCSGALSAFVPGVTECNSAVNMLAPCKHADFNKDQVVTVQDIFDFLTHWFAGSPLADLPGNGTGAPSVQAIFSFLAAWFTG